MIAFPKHAADRRFLATMSVVAAAVIVAGFSNPYGPKVISGLAPIPAIIHLHAALFGCWLALAGLLLSGTETWHLVAAWPTR